LELVIGPQPPVPKLGLQETHNRFAIYLQGFMQAISQAGHPLVLFLDDLQWADMASLQALKMIFQAPRLTHLLIIGAYRDNEVLPGDPLLITLDEIAATGIPVSTIALQPLEQEHVALWIADTLRHNVTTVQPLSDLVYEKTLGNPFFVRQFLQSLYEEGLLWCEPRTGEGQPNWQWDLDRIRHHAHGFEHQQTARCHTAYFTGCSLHRQPV
jgi:predicted ATPase